MKYRVHIRKTLLATLASLTVVGGMAGFQAQPESSLITNASFEDGKDWPNKWSKGRAIDGVEYLWDRAVGHEGKSSLCIKKTAQRYFPIADWSQAIPNSGKTSRLKVSVWIKAEGAHKSIVDVGFTIADGTSSHQWAAYVGAQNQGDPAATHDWKLYEGVVVIPPNTKELTIRLQTYGPGTTWFDDVKAEYVPDSTPETKFGAEAKPKSAR